MNVAILGTGNVAWHLARSLENAGHIVTDIYSRDIGKAKSFALDFFNANVTNNLNFSNSKANVFLLAISDDAIAEIAPSIQLPKNGVLAHCSGSVPLKALGYAQTENVGVFYPLQTFSKGKKVDFSEIPIGIEGENKFTEKILLALGRSISSKTEIMDSKARKVIHLSAVFACNFTNHMFTIAKNILEAQNLNFELLQPLIVETLNKSLAIGPENAQTGPAKRGDMEILDKHFSALQNDSELAEIYRVISQHILDYYAE